APPRHDDFESVDCDDDFEGKLRQQLQELIHSEEEEGLQIPDSLSSSSSYSSSSIGPVGNSQLHAGMVPRRNEHERDGIPIHLEYVDKPTSSVYLSE
ncbi:hypothetical protein BHE74_00056345, partial [Ensete ventricosum]